MRFDELALPPGPIAYRVECRADRICTRRLMADIVLKQEKGAVLASDSPIDSTGYQKFSGRLGSKSSFEGNSTGHRHAQAVRSDEHATDQRTLRRTGSGSGCSRRGIVQSGHLLVERILWWWGPEG